MEKNQEKSVSGEDSDGLQPSNEPNNGSAIGGIPKEFVYFIWDNAEKYLPKFRRFNVDGVDKFVITWHWPAFFFALIWMAYRKMYGWALAAFIFERLFFTGYFFLLEPITSFLDNFLGEAVWIITGPLMLFGFLFPLMVFGITANYLYYKHAKRNIIEYKIKQSPLDTHEMAMGLRKKGGVNWWAAALVFVLFFLPEFF
jgi:hypothetical protein